jgi:hypothetical protein
LLEGLPDGLVDTFLSIVGEFGEASTLVSARAQPTSPKVDCSGKRRMAGLLENLRFLNLIFVGAGGGAGPGGGLPPLLNSTICTCMSSSPIQLPILSFFRDKKRVNK